MSEVKNTIKVLLNKFLETQSQFGMFANFFLLWRRQWILVVFKLDSGYSVWWNFCIDFVESGWRVWLGFLELKKKPFPELFYFFVSSKFSSKASALDFTNKAVNLMRTRTWKSSLNYPSPTSVNFKIIRKNFPPFPAKKKFPQFHHNFIIHKRKENARKTTGKPRKFPSLRRRATLGKSSQTTISFPQSWAENFHS